MSNTVMALGTTDPSKRRRILWDSKKDTETRSSRHTTGKAQKLLALPPSFTYEGLYSTYRQQWEEGQKKQSLNVVVSDHFSFSISTVSWLVACTSLGDVLLWRVTTDTASSECNGTSTVTPPTTSPFKRIRVSKLPLKSIQVVVPEGSGSSHSLTILVGGEEGLFSISSPVHEESPACKKWCTVTSRIQQILVDEAADRVYLLGEKQKASLIQVYNLSNQKWIHSIDLGSCNASVMALSKPIVLKNDEDETHAHPSMLFLLIGTTNSQLLIWKNPPPAYGSSVSGTMEIVRLHDPDSSRSNVGNGGGVCQTIPFDITVTAICSSQDQWWTIAGACNTNHNKSRNSISTASSSASSGVAAGAVGGVLATLHGPTRTLVSYTETRETIQGISIITQGDSAGVYTAANEGVVSVWESPYRLERPLLRIWTNPPSGHTITSISLCAAAAVAASTTAVDGPSTSAIVISGVGCQVDILQSSCRVQTLQAQDEDQEVTS